MTTDALLNIALTVGVPGLMALIGGILAARSIPSNSGKRTPEFYVWSSGFVVLFLLSVILSFVQQIRNTNQQIMRDSAASAIELRNNGDVKYMEGELASMNKVLGNISTRSDPAQIVGMLKGITLKPPIQAPNQGLEPPGIQKMTNGQLRARVIEFANQMRKFESDHEQQEEALFDGNQARPITVPTPEESRKIFQERNTQIIRLDQNFRLEVSRSYLGPATEYKDEMLRRLGPQAPLSEQQRFELFWWPDSESQNISQWSVKATASDLENLARQLP
jgi:hypothetical protein